MHNHTTFFMEKTVIKIKNGWSINLLYSMLITGVSTAVSCMLLLDYNLFLFNQLSLASIIALASAGIAAGIIAPLFNIKSVKFLRNSYFLKHKLIRLLLLNLPLFIFQLFAIFATVMIIGND